MAASGDLSGRFRILGPLGAGAMGEVYRARDLRLGRDVALKVLPVAAAADPERRLRFEHEARAVAALNHGNILALYDLGEHGGTPYLVTELLEGETLRRRLARGPLPVKEAVGLLVQVARGLAAAHAAGIVHRDLKPENLFVTDEGVVKILDFGLATLRGGAEGQPDPEAATVTGLTRAGAVLGTAGYMAPEQVRGQKIDRRADIFAFGCVLYEVLAGRRPFGGDTAADTLGAILREEPAPVEGVATGVSPALAQIVRRCLEKRPQDRFSSAHDLALALEAAVSDVGVELARAAVAARPRRRTAGPLLVAVAAVALVAVALLWLNGGRLAGRGAPHLDPLKVMIARFENRTGDPSLDPIGSMVAEAITQGLVELGRVEVVPAPEEGRGATEPADEDALRAAATAAGAGMLVSGSYYLVHGDLDLRGRVGDVGSGKLLYALRPEIGPRAAPDEAIDRVRQRSMGAVLLRLGDAPALGGLTTPPLYSAYQEFVAGAMMMGLDSKVVIAHLEKAAAIDPEFWHPQLRLMPFYRAGDRPRYEAMRRHLQENIDRLGPADRILLQYYDAQLAGRTLEAYRLAREGLALAPRDPTAIFAASNLALDLGRPREALGCIGDWRQLDWQTFGKWMQGTWLLGVVAFSHHLLGEHEAELEAVDFGIDHYPDMLNMRQDRVRALAVLGRLDEVDRTLTESLTIGARLGTPSSLFSLACEELRAHGHPEAARRVAARGVEWIRGQAAGSLSATARMDLIECLWVAERWDEARAAAVAAVAAAPDNPYLQGYRGLTAAQGGDRATAEEADSLLAADDRPPRKGDDIYFRACIAAQLGERDRAVALLRQALAGGFNGIRALHVYVLLEPLHGYPPFEELIRLQ